MNILIIILTFLILQPSGYVNDRAGLLDNQTIAKLEQQISSFEQQTEIEIAVLIQDLPTSENVFDFALGKAEDWGVGKDGADNGIFIYLAPNAKKWQILTGYGIEGFLTDYETGRIGAEHIVSNMRDQNPSKAITATVSAIISELGTLSMAERIRQSELAEQAREEKLANLMSVLFWICIGIVSLGGIFLSIYFVRRKRKAEKERQEIFKRTTSKISKAVKHLADLKTDFNLKGLDNHIELLNQAISLRQNTEAIDSTPDPPAVTQQIINNYSQIREVLLEHEKIGHGLPKDALNGVKIKNKYDNSGVLKKLEIGLKNYHHKVKTLLEDFNKHTDVETLIFQVHKICHADQAYEAQLERFKQVNAFYANLPKEVREERQEAIDILAKVDEHVEEAEQLLNRSKKATVQHLYEKAYLYASQAVMIAEDELEEQERKERRKRREQRRKQRISSSSSYTSSSSYSSFGRSSSSSSGFGGFGGGSFGGGGSGGSW